MLPFAFVNLITKYTLDSIGVRGPMPPRPPLSGERDTNSKFMSTRPASYPRGGVRIEPQLSTPSRTLQLEEENRRALRMQHEQENHMKAIQLARQLEEEERATAELISSLANQEKFECGVCMEEKLVEDVARIDGCNHEYCRECLREYIGSQLASGAFPIICAHCRAEKAKDPAGLSI